MKKLALLLLIICGMGATSASEAATYPTFDEEWTECADAKALGVFREVDWSIKKCTEDLCFICTLCTGPLMKRLENSKI